MKEMKAKARKLFAVMLSALMVLSLTSIMAFAQEVDSKAGGTATITIENAAKGETYSVYKLFDATVTGTDGGSIAYTGTIPESLEDYFEANSAGNISVKENVSNNALFTALAGWAASEDVETVASKESDGSVLTFTNLKYGYYVVTATQTTSTTNDEGTVTTKSAITVTSTNPSATVYDKNTATPTPGDDNGGDLKTVGDADVSIGDTDVSIGDTVIYTIKFTTSNFEGAGADAKRIISYTIADTLPDFLSNVTVKSITIGGTDYKVNNATPQFNNDGQITIPWATKGNDGAYTSLYNNSVVIEVIYAATVNKNIEVGGAADANKNEVAISWKVDDGTEGGSTSEKTLKDDVVISTYAAAIQKVDESNNNLAGAKFRIKGLIVTGSKGNYTVDSYDASENAVDGTEMEGDDNGLIVINGIASDATLVATETVAPDGYNKLANTFTVNPVETSQKVTTTTVTTYYDEKGNEVNSVEESVTSETVVKTLAAVVTAAKKIENSKGAILPSTGGMGTTMLYVVGGLLIVGAGVALVVRRRMGAAE